MNNNTDTPRSILDIEREQLASPFGKDIGLIHELVIRGREQNVGRAFWRLLQEDKAAFERAIEAAVTFPTFRCSLKEINLSIPELVKFCEQPTKEFAGDGYKSRLTGPLTVDESDDIEYASDSLDISLFIVPRETNLRDLEQQLVGLYFRPARLKETLLLAAQHRNLKCPEVCPGTVLCLQRCFIGEDEVRVKLTRDDSSFKRGVEREIEELPMQKLQNYVIKPRGEWVAIPCVKQRRI